MYFGPMSLYFYGCIFALVAFQLLIFMSVLQIAENLFVIFVIEL